MKITRSLSLALFAFGAFTSSTHAKADTIGSYVGTTAPAGFNNGPVTTGSGAVVAYNYPLPYSTIAGTTYVTFAQGNQPAGLTTYSTTDTNNLTGDIGTISVEADDFTTVSLNGVLLGTTAGTPFDTPKTFAIPAGIFSTSNTFTFGVTNVSGYTGVDFLASATASPTPEPSSFLLLGTGILGFAGAVRRRFAA